MVDPDEGNLQSKVFFVWGSFCFVCIAFVWAMIYETKGLTLEEVDELYDIVSKAWHSKEFRPAVKFREVEEEVKRGLSLAEARESVARRKSSAAYTEGSLGEDKRF